MASKLVLVDGHALVYRAYHATPPMTSARTGEQTNATYGFAAMLFKVLADVKPDFVAVAFDRSGPTFRHQEFEQYKAHRPSQPEDLRPQFKRVRELVDSLGIPVYELDGFEADDVIGSIATQAEAKGIETLIVTGDSDALQLVTPMVHVFMPRRTMADTATYDEAAVRERYGLAPKQLVDYKALKGDPSDNIPGVPGIGEKTASKLIAEFGDLDRLYARLNEAPAKQQAILEQNRDAAYQGRRLVQIVCDAPVELDADAARFAGYDRERVVNLLRELEFASLLNRLPQPRAAVGAGAKASPTAVAATGVTKGKVAANGAAQMSLFDAPADAVGATVTNLPLRVVASDLALTELGAALAAATEPVAVRVIGDDPIQPMRANLVGLAFVAGGVAWYVPIGHLGFESTRQLDRDLVLGQLRPFLSDAARPKIGHNVKYDLIVLARNGIELQGVVGDVMLAGYLLEANQRAFGLRDQAFAKLGHELAAAQSLTGTGRSARLLGQAEIDAVAKFAGDEVSVIEPLRQTIEPALRDAGLWSLYVDLELPLSGVLAAMERVGVSIDVALLREASRDLGERLAATEKQIFDSVGHQFNVNSPIQLGQVLFEELKLTGGKKTKTGYSTDASVLEGLRGAHPVVDMVLEYRQVGKLKSTYVDALPVLVNAQTGRVHTSFNQTGAVTGRMSSSDPNLQNIPIRTDLGRSIRRAFVASGPNRALLAADYSQVELRILAHVTHDAALIAAFQAGRDIHTATAMDMFEVAEDQVSADQRRVAKTLNFAIIYGVSAFGLAENLKIPRATATDYMERYSKRYPAVTAWQETTLKHAREQGYVETLFGRRRYIPEIHAQNYQLRQGAERMAINAPIQGAAADIIKRAMTQVRPALANGRLKADLILQVHDELVFDADVAEIPRLAPVVRAVMSGAHQLDVPLVVDVKAGANWEEMSAVESVVD